MQTNTQNQRIKKKEGRERRRRRRKKGGKKGGREEGMKTGRKEGRGEKRKKLIFFNSNYLFFKFVLFYKKLILNQKRNSWWA